MILLSYSPLLGAASTATANSIVMVNLIKTRSLTFLILLSSSLHHLLLLHATKQPTHDFSLNCSSSSTQPPKKTTNSSNNNNNRFFLLHLVDKNTTPNQTTSSSTSASNPKTKKIFPIVLASSVAITSTVLLLLIIFLIFRCKKRAANTATKRNQESSNICRHFSIQEIKTATKNFDTLIGEGGFGNVYKGHIDTCNAPVAVKRLRPGSDQGAHEFRTEIEMLSKFRHPHLVSLIGYCNDNGEMILVYDFMARGTLRDHLYGSNHSHCSLDWNTRLEICIASARGIDFLHTGVEKRSVIHRDVKSTNILLDENWVAKVSDFGLSKDGPNGSTHVTTEVKGSLGYLDPEYYMSLWLSQKSDVYSFGVVLLEVLCGRPPIKSKVEKQEEFLVTWFKKSVDEGKVDRMVDTALRGSIRHKCLNKFVEVALSCLDDHGKQRPTMRDVVEGLECAWNLQQEAGGDIVRGKREKKKKKKKEMGLTKIEVHDHKELIEENTGRVDKSSSSKGKMTRREEEEDELALVHCVV